MSDLLGAKIVGTAAEKVSDTFKEFQNFTPEPATLARIETATAVLSRTYALMEIPHLAALRVEANEIVAHNKTVKLAGRSSDDITYLTKQISLCQEARRIVENNENMQLGGRSPEELKQLTRYVTDITAEKQDAEKNELFKGTKDAAAAVGGWNPINWASKKFLGLDLNAVAKGGGVMDLLTENPLKALGGAYALKKMLGSGAAKGFADMFPTKLAGFLGVVALIAKFLIEASYADAKSPEAYAKTIAPVREMTDTLFKAVGMETPEALAKFYKMDPASIAKLSVKDATQIAVQTAKDIPDEKITQVAEGLADITTERTLSPAETDAKLAGVIGTTALAAARAGQEVTDVLKDASTQAATETHDKFSRVESVASTTTTPEQADTNAELQKMLDATTCNAVKRHLNLSDEEAKNKISSCANLG
jgi:predicted RNA-binding Zn ribbon-like protein